MYLEAEDLGFIPSRRFVRYKSGVDLEHDIDKGRAEVSAINGGMAGGFGVVEIFASRTVEFDVLGIVDVRHAGREQVLGFAVNPGTFAKISFLVFFELEQTCK